MSRISRHDEDVYSTSCNMTLVDLEELCPQVRYCYVLGSQSRTKTTINTINSYSKCESLCVWGGQKILQGKPFQKTRCLDQDDYEWVTNTSTKRHRLYYQFVLHNSPVFCSSSLEDRHSEGTDDIKLMLL